jgi:hypothetical protein
MSDLAAEMAAFLWARAGDDEVMAADPVISESLAEMLYVRARAMRLLVGDSGVPEWDLWGLQLRQLTWSYAWHPDFDRAWLPRS